MHYAVPRLLHEAGQLERLFTDVTVTSGWPRLLNLIPQSLLPASAQRFATRKVDGIPKARITAFTSFGLKFGSLLPRCKNKAEATKLYLWAGEEFCRLIVARGFGGATGVYTFNTAGLELLRAAKARGLHAVMEQTIAPKRIEEKLLAEEHERWKDWEDAPEKDVWEEKLMGREEAEWQAADLILCGSQFVAEGIRQCGGPVEKCAMVPYGVDVAKAKAEMPKTEMLKAEMGNRPLRVLTVGAVGLRKGSPYVLEAAKRLKGMATFRMVGPVLVSPEAQTKLREHIELTGVVPRSAMHEQFAWANVFLLPSICEGSATATYEALACGLPVICTANTGSVITDGEQGFIVPPRAIDPLIERLSQLRESPEELADLSKAALKLSEHCTVAAYAQRLLAALSALS
ncbi:MAG: glycosyltransferase [Verrucomicrobia bacterium]|nr:MAG: glycosyltransferase [Verrucomicrobiota bacterium]